MSSHLRLNCFLLVGIVLFPAFASCQPQRPGADKTGIEHDLLALKDGTLCERKTAVIALHHLRKSALSILIFHIGDSDLAKNSANILANPLISYRPAESQNDYFTGELYAYVVELILGRAKLNADPAHCDFVLDEGDYVYGLGIMRKTGDLPIAVTDLPRIKQIYTNWWETNRNRSLAQMHQNWKQSSGPLIGSQFSWH